MEFVDNSCELRGVEEAMLLDVQSECLITALPRCKIFLGEAGLASGELSH